MMHLDTDPPDDLGFALGDRVELVSTSDPHTRLRPGDHGTVTGISQVPSDSPDVQIHIAWDSGSTLTMLPDAGDQLRKLADDQDPGDPT
jgi:hypothetical protein